MKDLSHYYRVLGLEPGASLEEVNQAYKDLVFIWHPDRIPQDNERLHKKAQEKIKEIKAAKSVEELTDCKKLTNFDNAYRIRIGDYRAFFILTIVSNTVNLEYLVNRGDAYNKEYTKNLRKKEKGKE